MNKLYWDGTEGSIDLIKIGFKTKFFCLNIIINICVGTLCTNILYVYVKFMISALIVQKVFTIPKKLQLLTRPEISST